MPLCRLPACPGDAIGGLQRVSPHRGAARWLLTARDRAGDSLALTQEALASLLGVQRTTVNAAAKQLQSEGLIEYRRGKVEIRDVDKLRERTCNCYGRVERHRAAVLGDAEASWISDCAE
ncbi:MAG: winged helix-turn-helix domain-containing protein [Sphingomonas sp.]|nr:winged helix-turn-helix domain-containing protein [Sphingomonas sp.]